MRKILCAVVKIIIALVIFAGVAFSLTVMVGADNEDVTPGELPPVTEVMREGFYSFRESIDISAYNIMPEELSGLFSAVIKDDPYLFYVDGSMSYSYKPGGAVLSLKPRYKMKGIEVFEAWDECRSYVRMVSSEAMKFENEAERALFLHDYICQSFEYDTELLSDNIFTMIKSGRGTCEAYTDIYTAVLRECGIEAHFVASDTISHIWNYVKIGGEWYHADLTWDDTDGGIKHRHFLLSDTAAKERGHKDWYSSVEVKCPSDKYDAGDISIVLHEGRAIGDADHDDVIGLSDLLTIRLELNGCAVCSDINSDLLIDGNDAESLRMLILERK